MTSSCLWGQGKHINVAGRWMLWLCVWWEWRTLMVRGPAWHHVCMYAHKHWKDISALGHMRMFVLLWDFMESACVCLCIFVCVWQRERERGSSCRSHGAPGLQKTSDPAGRLRGRSGCVDSFLRQMREQKCLCLSSAAYVDVSEDGTTHHIRPDL